MKYQIVKDKWYFYIRYKYPFWPFWLWIEESLHDASVKPLKVKYTTLEEAKHELMLLANPKQLSSEYDVVLEIDTNKSCKRKI